MAVLFKCFLISLPQKYGEGKILLKTTKNELYQYIASAKNKSRPVNSIEFKYLQQLKTQVNLPKYVPS